VIIRWRSIAIIYTKTQKPALARTKAQEGLMTVFIYVDTNKQVGDKDHLTVFATEDAANAWFAEHDPEGMAFEYGVLE
jgi:hypothetical protein